MPAPANDSAAESAAHRAHVAAANPAPHPLAAKWDLAADSDLAAELGLAAAAPVHVAMADAAVAAALHGAAMTHHLAAGQPACAAQ